MATDAQGRQLSDDDYYYWDGANLQPVIESGAGSTSPEQNTATGAQGRQLSEDGNYYWDGANWQLVAASGGNGATADTGQTITADDIITGAHPLTTAAEVAEIFGHLSEALGVWVEPIDGLILIIGGAEQDQLTRIAHDGDPGRTVTNIYQHLCSESDDHALAMAYSALPWPGPVCA
jgi:hypothetical protein